MQMKRILGTGVFLLTLAGYGLSGVEKVPQVSIRGFFPAAAARQAEVERIFRAFPTADRAREDLQILTREPHVAGTPADYRTAQYVLRQFRRAGLEAHLVEYQVLLVTPQEVRVDLVEPIERPGPTAERAWDLNSRSPSVIAAFNAYSPSGNVTAEVVYANYGLPKDYDWLEKMGIEAAGKIVLVRYGTCFRGVKAYVAEQHGAAGVLMYSDPADDGYRRGDPYPGGPWRPASGVQRGSILYLTAYAGDPLTPGVAATAAAKRLTMEEAHTLPHIPTTPISYQDAAPILENLGGPVAPHDWQGALPFTYHVGPGASKVHLKLEMDFQVRPIWNVIARIPGTAEPDRRVVLGNHRDAWTYGAVDPNSGTAPLLAVARGLGRLLKQGWKPRRTIFIASWDAEEYGLIGSTEWVEEHADALSRNAVAYLNIDVGVSGPHFGAAAVPSLWRLIREVTREVEDPTSGRELFAVWSEESRQVRPDSGLPIAVPRQEPSSMAAGPAVGELGSGSDYTPFLQHLGVPSLDIGFGGPYGVYHAAYDNFRWMERFGDPTFQYSVTAAQIYGTLTLRLASADALPFDYEDYGRAIQKYLGDLQAELRSNHVAQKLPFGAARNSARRFTRTAQLLGEELAAVTTGRLTDPQRLAAVNQALMDVERGFLLEDGLPNRSWFRHAFYAPGVYTGYAALVVPGVREAAARQDWAAAAEQLDLVRTAIDRGNATLWRALRALGRPPEQAVRSAN